MSDATPHVFVWDIPEGACGASRNREQAMATVGNELTSAKPGTTATVAEMRVSQIGVDYILVRVIGHAERTGAGVVWSETAAVRVPGGSPAAVHPS